MTDPCLGNTPSKKIVEVALSWQGTPYHHQASVKHIGTDCLGLLRGVWCEVYGCEPELAPAYSRDWAERLGQETLYNAALRHMQPVGFDQRQTGDLLLFRWRPDSPAKHCALQVSSTHMIHAYEPRGVVQAGICGWWLRHLAFVFRFPNLEQTLPNSKQ